MCVCVCVYGLVLKLILLETCLLNIHIYINLDLKIYSAFFNIPNNATVRTLKLSINFLCFLCNLTSHVSHSLNLSIFYILDRSIQVEKEVATSIIIFLLTT